MIEIFKVFVKLVQSLTEFGFVYHWSRKFVMMFCLSLVKKVAQVLSTNHRTKK